MIKRRSLCKVEFERLFMLLYKDLLQAAKRGGYEPDAVHQVYVQVMDQETYKDQGRGKKQVRLWLMMQVRKEGQRSAREERIQFGRRRIDERD